MSASDEGKEALIRKIMAVRKELSRQERKRAAAADGADARERVRRLPRRSARSCGEACGDDDAAASPEGLLERAGLTVEALRAVLASETAARTSAAVQAKYAEAECDDSMTDWIAVTGELQRGLLAEAGVNDECMPVALHVLRSAARLFSAERLPEAHNSIHARFNRARQGDLAIGQACPAVRLFPLAADDVRCGAAGSLALTDLCPPGGLPVAIVAGSYT